MGGHKSNGKSHELPKTDLNGHSASYLDASGRELAILYSHEGSHRVLKSRLSDNLVVLDEVILSQGSGQLGADVLLINKRSHLGYLEAHDLRNSTVKDLKGYNFDVFRGN